jgi:hypothetical protein
VKDQKRRYARIRHTATGALAALVAVGAIAGTTALAAKSHARPHHHARHHHATVANGTQTKTPTPQGSQPTVNAQPFLNAIQQLVNNGTITAAQGQAVDNQLRHGYFDSSKLRGFTQTQIQAITQALGNAKRSLAP